MWGIFLQSVVIFQNYAGHGIYMALFLLALIYLTVAEKDKILRVFFVYTPYMILFCFFNPIFRKGFARIMDDVGTYYRILWLVPMSIITVYAAIKCLTESGIRQRLDEKNTETGRRAWGSVFEKAGILVLALLVILGGKLVYDSENITRAQNAYHLPQTVIDICETINPTGSGKKVVACFPNSLVYFVRQYNSDIQMPYGREMVEPVWDYYNPIYEVVEKAEVIDTDLMLETTRTRFTTFIILKQDRELDEPMEKYGCKLLANIDGYLIYEDVEETQVVKELLDQYDY